MVDVTCIQQAEIEDGPSISNTAKLTTPTGTGYIDVTVAAGASRIVEVQPGDSGDVVVFFILTSGAGAAETPPFRVGRSVPRPLYRKLYIN